MQRLLGEFSKWSFAFVILAPSLRVEADAVDGEERVAIPFGREDVPFSFELLNAVNQTDLAPALTRTIPPLLSGRNVHEAGTSVVVTVLPTHHVA
jgi:hypothetical protein